MTMEKEDKRYKNILVWLAGLTTLFRVAVNLLALRYKNFR